jgi:hypothetical protein
MGGNLSCAVHRGGVKDPDNQPYGTKELILKPSTGEQIIYDVFYHPCNTFGSRQINIYLPGC